MKAHSPSTPVCRAITAFASTLSALFASLEQDCCCSTRRRLVRIIFVRHLLWNSWSNSSVAVRKEQCTNPHSTSAAFSRTSTTLSPSRRSTISCTFAFHSGRLRMMVML
uniref:Putative secreted protein n=1 Tax=Anopheles triannulatus TaxID=58253 RepID=A0A2M4B339_9DIPT